MSHISLSAAAEMTSRFRAQKENILIPELRGLEILPVCETVDRTELDSILAQADCTKVRIYYGMNTDQTVHAVLVGVNSSNEDILPAASASSTATGSNIIDDAYRCPPTCPPDSDLNS